MASGPINSWEIDGETVKRVSDFTFLSSKITTDGDRSHEIKGHLLLGRKVMTNLNSILKSRDITLPTKVCLVKAVVFPVSHVWMWELDYKESWAPKNWCFWTVVWRRLLRVPWTARTSNQSILKEISPGCSLVGLILKLKLQYFGHLMWRTDSFEKTLMLGKTEGSRRGWQRMRSLDGITDLMDEFEKVLGVGERQGSLACCSSCSHKELDMTERLNWIIGLNIKVYNKNHHNIVK